jgi:crotonobetainyl-CoA:carnitine CoA-transferase CaiB-like acyl-CoA transferase
MGYPDRPPTLPSFPLADMTSGLYGVSAVMFALYHRDLNAGTGQSIDLSLFESLFSILGPLSAEYAALGKIRIRQGNRSTNSAPRGCYQTADNHWIAVSGSTPKMAERFLKSYGLGDMLADPRFSTNEARVRNSAEVDAAIGKAMVSRTLAENMQLITENKLTAHPVQDIADIEHDPHWQARQLTLDINDDGRAVRMHNVVPRFSATPGEIRWAGRDLGHHNQEVYCEELGMSVTELERLKNSGVI